MDIVIVSQFGSTYSRHDNDRFLYLANLLSDNNEVEIVTSSFCHEKKIHRRFSESEWPFNITFINEPGYSKNVCIKRFSSHYIFGKNLVDYIKNRKKPDVIYCAVPSLTGIYSVSKYCKLNGIRFIIDIQDLWPEAFRMVFKIPIISDMFFFPFTLLANGIYKNADSICAVSKTYADRAIRVNKKCNNGISVYLGTDLEAFDDNAKNNSVTRSNEAELRLAYCGTLGSSYDLICVIDALAILSSRGLTPPKFIVMGDGPEKERFERYSIEKKVNTEFVGRVSYDKMCGILMSCDMVVNPISGGAAQSIINKHADYAASGLPVISTQESIEYRNLIERYKMGFNCTNNSSEDLAEKIALLLNNKDMRREMGENARRCALDLFDRKKTYGKIIQLIEKQ